MTLPESQRAYPKRCSSWKEGDAETREDQLKNNSAALGQDPGPPLGDTHSSIFELFGRTKAFTEWKLLTI